MSFDQKAFDQQVFGRKNVWLSFGQHIRCSGTCFKFKLWTNLCVGGGWYKLGMPFKVHMMLDTFLGI
jgi:hypothetical protein